MANRGGFSWKRAVGVTRVKQTISRATGIPLTKSGRQRKIGRIVTPGGGCLLPIIASLACLLLLGGCKTTGSVQGRLVSKTSGQPVAGAVVRLPSGNVTTDEQGGFSATGLDIGTVQASVVASGFEPFTAKLTVAERVSATETVEFPDAALRVKVKERAVEPKAVRGAVVRVGEATATAQPDGSFVLTGLPSGTMTATVSASGHETSSTAVPLASGENAAAVTLGLTPLETYKRFRKAADFHRDSVSYRYIHPDERKLLSLKKWKAWSGGVENRSVKFGDVRFLSKWKSPYTKKTYRHVAEVDRTEVGQVTDPKYSDFGKVYTNNFSQHFVKLNGIWYLVHVEGP